MMEAQALTSWLPRMVLHDEMTGRFSDLHWWTIEYKPEAPKLLLSDMPLYWEGGLHSEDFLIAMPLAPNRLFLGAGSEAARQYLNDLPGAELIRRVNRGSLASSRNRIWGVDAAEGRAVIEANLDIVGVDAVSFGEIAKRFQDKHGRD